ncbi:MAG: DUF5684 domain-containing protein [Propionicimonas sp.]|uniref:DUF5684 domain-containing protein n=1 Tax=Propionicimonas sp. TaxID=1955623 RepID=UPI003D0F9069
MRPDSDSAAQALLSLPVILVSIVIGLITLIALWKLFTKAGEHGWAAIIPFYDVYVQFRVAGFNPWLFLLLLVPLVNVILLIVVQYRIGIAFGKSPLWSIFLMVILPTIGLLILGFGSATYDRSRIA